MHANLHADRVRFEEAIPNGITVERVRSIRRGAFLLMAYFGTVVSLLIWIANGGL